MIMKNMIKLFFVCLALLSCPLLCACSDSEEKAQVEVAFTGLEGIDPSLLDETGEITGSFELESTGNWQLYSNKIWMTLSLAPDGEFYNDIQGGLGKYTVYVKVTGEARGFTESQATLTLFAGEKSEVVATVVRPALEYEFSVVGSNGEVLNGLNIDYSGIGWVGLSANFECAITAYPHWMKEPEMADGGYTLAVADEFVPMEQSGELQFGNADGSIVYSVPVEYAGMDPYKVVVESDYTPWGWNVSLDGKSFTFETDSPSGETVVTTIENELRFAVTCYNYDCRFVLLEESNGKLSVSGNPWANVLPCDGAAGLVSVTVEPFEATQASRSRSGYIFAVPAALYAEFESALSAGNGTDEFVDKYMSYVLLQLTQKDLHGSEGFAITDSSGTSMESVKEGELYEWLCSEYSITDVTTCTLVPGESYTINTKLTSAEWAKNYGMTDLEGNNVRVSRWNFSIEQGADGFYYIKIKVPATLDETILLRLYTPQIVNIKALVIRPQTKE